MEDLPLPHDGADSSTTFPLTPSSSPSDRPRFLRPTAWVPSLLHGRTGPATGLRSAANGQPIVGSSIAPGWQPALVLIGMASLLFGIVFQRDVTGAVQVWILSTAYNHCFLILPLVAFLLWERRAVFSLVSPRPVLWPLLLMPLLSGVWLVAAVLDLQEGRQLALTAMFETIVLVTLGPRIVWLLMAPLLFLFFLVPSGAFLTPSLQTITADIAIAGLRTLHIPVFSDGYMIAIPEGDFEIAEACAGLRFLIASAVFGCFFAIVMYRSFIRRTLFIMLSLTIPIAANGLRALGIILLAHLEGSAAAVEADHILYGWLFFTLVIMILIAIGIAFVQKGDQRPSIQAASLPGPPAWKFAVAALAAVLLALTGPAYARLLDSGAFTSPLPPADSPSVAPPWRLLTDARPDWHPSVHGADREFLESFEAPGSGLILRYVALYRLGAVGNLLTSTENRLTDDSTWRVADRGRAEVSLHGKELRVVSTEVVSGPRRRLIWSFYVVDGKIAVGLLEAKLLKARAVLFGRAPVGAFVAVSASMDGSDDRAEKWLARFMTESQSLPEYLALLR